MVVNVTHTLFVKGLNYMSTTLTSVKSVHCQCDPIRQHRELLKVKMTFSVNTLEYWMKFCVLACKGKIFLNIRMVIGVICVHFGQFVDLCVP